jgi:hypothetical protein
MKTPLLIVAGALVFVCGLVFVSVQSVPKQVGLSAEEVAKFNAKVSADKKAADAAEAARLRPILKKREAELQAYEKARAKEETKAKANAKAAAAAAAAAERADCLQLSEVRIAVYEIQLEKLQAKLSNYIYYYQNETPYSSNILCEANMEFEFCQEFFQEIQDLKAQIRALKDKIDNTTSACG